MTGNSEPLKAFGKLDGVKILDQDGNTICCKVPNINLAQKFAKDEDLTLEEITRLGIILRNGPSVHCFCGLKLHYVYPHVRRDMESLCKQQGEHVTIRQWLVPRHYIALHGLDYENIEKLGFQKAKKPISERKPLERAWLTSEAKAERKRTGFVSEQTLKRRAKKAKLRRPR